MQTLEKRNKQLIIYAEINAIMKQSNNLVEIINANQKAVNNLKAESDKLEKEINIEKEKSDHGFKFNSFNFIKLNIININCTINFVCH